jgi:hypothetical protein
MAHVLAQRGAVTTRRANDKVWPVSTSGGSRWRRARWWSAGLTIDDRRCCGGEVVHHDGISLAVLCSGGWRWTWGAPTAQGVTGDEAGSAEEDGDDRECELTMEGEIDGGGFSFRRRQQCSDDQPLTRSKWGGVGARGAHEWEKKKRKGERRERRRATQLYYTGVRMWGTAREGVPRGGRGRGESVVKVA